MVGSEISASEVRSQEFKALKPLSKVRGHHFRPIFSRTVPHVGVQTGIRIRIFLKSYVFIGFGFFYENTILKNM